MLPPLCQRRRLQRVVLSRLNRTALALAIYASSSPLRCRRRKTRFRWLARPCRVGLVTHRVPAKGFRDHSSIPSSFPELSWRKVISPGREMASLPEVLSSVALMPPTGAGAGGGVSSPPPPTARLSRLG